MRQGSGSLKKLELLFVHSLALKGWDALKRIFLKIPEDSFPLPIWRYHAASESRSTEAMVNLKLQPYN